MIIKTKTKKIKNINEQEAKYICMNQDNKACNKCPLRVDYITTNPNHACYYLLKLLMKEKGEKTITL